MTEEELFAQRDQMEAALERWLGPSVERFMAELIEQAVDHAQTITAAARRDPFAYTNVVAAWRATIGGLVELIDYPDASRDVTAMLSQSLIPDMAFQQASDIVDTAYIEGWSKAKTRRELRKALLPTQHEDEDTTTYRSRVRNLARTAATRASGERALQDMASRGVRSKRWVAALDERTRPSHIAAHGQEQPIEQPFLVGDQLLMHPGDPTATIDETANCRCVIAEVAYSEENQNEVSDMTVIRAAAESPAAAQRARWAGPIGMEGVTTGDGRLIEPEALRWGELPIPLRHVPADVGGHDGAVTVGTVDTIERRDGGVIWGEGYIDLGSEEGREAARQIELEQGNGVSMDLDDVSFEIRIAKEVMDDLDEAMADDDVIEAPTQEVDEEGRVIVAKINANDELTVFVDARVRAATLVSIPAFVEARVTLMGETTAEDEAVVEEAEAIVAAAAPVRPPKAWFENPNLDGPTALTITEEGRIYGHLATWGTCHIGMSEACVTPPYSITDYAYFHVGSLFTKEGDEIAVGRITMDTGHANEQLGAAKALAHYDHTGTGAADVRVGEDSHGIWVAGALRSNLTEEQKRSLRSSPLSGDWRRVNGNLELVAALAVNVPGFPIPRPSGFVASGVQTTLLASSGMMPPSRVARPGTPNALSDDDLKWLKRLAAEKRSEQAQKRAKILHQRVQNLAARIGE